MSSRNLTRVRSFSVRDSLQNLRHSRRYRRSVTFIQWKPFTSFFITLGILLLVLILGSVISNLSKKEVKTTTPVKTVSVYTIGKAPTVPLQAQVEKNGIVKIVAQAPGIVQTVHVHEGDTITKGQSIVSLSSNYQGGNAPALQAQLAGAQVRNVRDTYKLQKGIINDQRDIATASAENTEQLRQISQKSLTDTRGLLGMNRSLLDSLNTQISQIEQANPNDPTLPALKGQQAQLQAGVNQLQSAVNSLDYQTNTSNPPTLLASKQKDITLKQLDVQEKALDLSKQVSSIQYSLALVQEGTMHPAAPFAGTIQRINVHEGDNVNPGTVIATIASSSVTSTAVLRVPQQIADTISRVEPTIFYIHDKKISMTPSYVSTVATDGQLYSIIYTFPDGISGVTDGEYLKADVPIGYAETNGVDPYVPIDSVYESQSDSTVFVLKNNSAVARKVTIGEVYGDYVSVLEGLHDGDQIILNRNIVAGDKVAVK